jgi:hypothetical protein
MGTRISICSDKGVSLLVTDLSRLYCEFTTLSWLMEDQRQRAENSTICDLVNVQWGDEQATDAVLFGRLAWTTG